MKNTIIKNIVRMGILIVMISQLGFSQTGEITGSVTVDGTDEPLVGANVTLKGTNLGDATD